MKNLLITSISILFIGLFSIQLNGQEMPKIKTEEFVVSGVCKMCKKRIEKAALIKGVKLAEWNKGSQTLKVMYSPKKVEADSILKAVAKAGHDTDKFKADKEIYGKLPDCCKYRDGIKVH